nr:GTPase ObgE [Candidatus Cloacimonadota bacterium]
IYDITEGKHEILGEIVHHGQEIIIAKGGNGGRGNTRFKSPTNKAPRYAKPGGNAEYREIELELKLMADVGLVGFPNAGKSTLLSKVSDARPKIADYQFTTLEPSLGVVKVSDYESFVMADIPGIIEGAHDGKGLGDQFLRHIQRTKTLLFLIDINSANPFDDYQALKKELHLYDPYLDKKPHLIVLSKTDTLTSEEVEKRLNTLKNEFETKLHEQILSISSVSGNNLLTLKRMLFAMIKTFDAEEE